MQARYFQVFYHFLILGVIFWVTLRHENGKESLVSFSKGPRLALCDNIQLFFDYINGGSVKSILPCHACHCSKLCACHSLEMISTVLIIFFSFTVFIQITVSTDLNTTVLKKNDSQDPTIKQGWTPQPDGRGTLDIIWSCVLTMSLCSWSILCMNFPAQNETRLQILWRKLALTALGLLCPEIIFEIALGQWLSARRSMTDINALGSGDRLRKDKWHASRKIRSIFSKETQTEDSSARGRWTIKDAFFADMGGFVLHTRDQLPFPLDAKQLHYLVSKQHLPLPELDHRVIEDKNKADGLLRTITLCQILWFIVNIMGRWAQRLTVTTFELTTVSFILCSLGTTFCWWNKPADAIVAQIIVSEISINDILRTEGHTLDEWRRTPLDFVSRKEWMWSRCWSNFVSILNHMHITFGSDVVPINRIPDSLQRELPIQPLYVCIGLGIGYFSVLFVGWNYNFPTRSEQILWRVACVTTMAMALVLLLIAQLRETIPSIRQGFRNHFAPKVSRINCLESGRQLIKSTKSGSICKKLNSALDGIRNNSTGKDPLLYIPLKIILPMYVVGFLYCSSRAYILIADVVELRSLPASAYATVNWQKFWPRLG